MRTNTSLSLNLARGLLSVSRKQRGHAIFQSLDIVQLQMKLYVTSLTLRESFFHTKLESSKSVLLGKTSQEATSNRLVQRSRYPSDNYKVGSVPWSSKRNRFHPSIVSGTLLYADWTYTKLCTATDDCYSHWSMRGMTKNDM